MNDEIITFDKLYTADYELCDIYAERQTWTDGVLFTRDRPRKSSGLIFLNGCAGEYTGSDGKGFYAPPGSLVCLPYKSEYSVLNVLSKIKTPDAYLVEFNVILNGEKRTLGTSPFRITEANAYYAGGLCESIVRAYGTLPKSPSELKSLIFRLIGYVGKACLSAENADYSLITPAIKLLEGGIEQNVTVERLAEMCHISTGYFRKLFWEYAGKSPVQYIIDRKIETAKRMLEDSGSSVSHISELLDFKSCSYFCRLFKKKTGMSPEEFRRRY